ncbi:hypothetical protein [Cohnella abietis]|uniref:Uncharacterized protein n=1 Tax=Cohnella abietis TaxID=2507935 RepID=A0A3T1CZX0_9BACL|nr:hypothetical protein [Cohnella abietis]BBI31384.1 hypothetical protein KCTCHS21_07830 [Cohnella abietis]
MLKTTKKTMVGILAASLMLTLPVSQVFASVGKPANAQYSAVQLKATPTKEMTYYKAGDSTIPKDIVWVTEKTDLTFLPNAVTDDVTSVVKDADGVFWIGTENGLQRVDFKETDARDIVQYLAGPQYLYGGDDHITGLASDGEGGIWARTATGVTRIAMPKKTLYKKSTVYEKLITPVNDRLGMVTGTNFTFTETNPAITSVNYSSPTGVFTGHPSSSDNDGLWTAMYALGEIFRYSTLKGEYGTNASPDQKAEITAAKSAALRATKAVLLLDYVSGRGNGYPARSYMLTSEAGAQTKTGDDYGYQPEENGFWFHHVVGPDAVNPNGIIPSLRRDEAPIGYSIVRVTRDSMTKKGSTLFPSGGTDVMNYNGIALSPAAIDGLNETRPIGQKLGEDIKTNIGKANKPIYQVLPVITTSTNNNLNFEDKTTSSANRPLFQLTAPVYEQIPTFFNDLLPNIIVDGHIDMNQIVYKADTSSDEIAGHSALFFAAYKYLCDEPADVETNELKRLIAQASNRLTNLILEDDHYYIEDATGKSTQWSRWLAQYFNDSVSLMKGNSLWSFNVGVDEEGEDALSYGYEDGPLNALGVMGLLKTAMYVTAADYPENQQKFSLAYDLAFDGGYSTEAPFVNGKGYIDLANEYIERRLVRQATNAYGTNGNKLVTEEAPGYAVLSKDIDWKKKLQIDTNINATLHQDWTQYINYSDEELGWFPVFQLIMLEKDPQRLQQIVSAFDQWYSNEVREENPFYTFLYQLAHPTYTNVDLNSAVRFLYRMPQYRITFKSQYNRQDVLYIEPGDRDKHSQTNYVLTPDERLIIKNNNNPFKTIEGEYSVNPNFNYKVQDELESATVFTLPYWMGRYFGIIEEVK